MNPEFLLNQVEPKLRLSRAAVEKSVGGAVRFTVPMMIALISLQVLVAGAVVANSPLELRGRIEPPMRATVALYDSTHPFQKQVLSNGKGHFRFKNLPAGTDTVSIVHPRRGEFRRTAEVTQSFASNNGWVEITIPFEPPKRESEPTLVGNNTVDTRLLSIDPKAVRRLEAAQDKLAKGCGDEAVAELRKAVQISPQFVAAWNLLGTISYQQREYEQAKRYFRSALEHDDDAFEPTIKLGGTLLSMGRHEDALPYSQYAVLARPQSVLANSQVGMNHFFLGEVARALEYLEKAKQLDPSHFSHPQLVLAELHAQQGRAPEAIEELKDFLRRHPDSQRADQVRRSIEILKGLTGEQQSDIC